MTIDGADMKRALWRFVWLPWILGVFMLAGLTLVIQALKHDAERERDRY